MFGKYKQSITDTLVRSYATNKKLFKESFHSLMGGLRENKIAREFFVLYGEIENKKFDDKKLAEEYLNTVIKTLKSKKKNLTIPVIKEQRDGVSLDDKTSVELEVLRQKELKKIGGGRGKTGELWKVNEKFKKLIDAAKQKEKAELKKENKIYSELDGIIFNESVRAIEKNLMYKRSLVNHLTRKDDTIKITESIPTSILATLATNKFNKKYASLNKEESKKLKEYLEIDNKKLVEEFTSSKIEVLDKLNYLKEANEDKEVLNKLNEVISQMDGEKLNKFSLYKINKLKKELN